MTRVYLVRHGLHNLVGKGLAGRMPGVHLSAEGQTQAARLGKHLAAFQISTVVSSPMERCMETAGPIATGLGLAVINDQRVNEIDCGEWTGRSFDELADDPRWRSWNAERGRNSVPGGEAIQQVQTRVLAALDSYAADDAGAMIVVSHSDVIKVVILTLLGGVLDWHDRIEIDPASMTTIDLWPGGGKILRMNEQVAS